MGEMWRAGICWFKQPGTCCYSRCSLSCSCWQTHVWQVDAEGSEGEWMRSAVPCCLRRRTHARARPAAACTYSLVFPAGMEGEGLVSVKPLVTRRCLSYYSFVFPSQYRSRLTLPALPWGAARPSRGMAPGRGNSGARGSCGGPGLEPPNPTYRLEEVGAGEDDSAGKSWGARRKILQRHSAELWWKYLMSQSRCYHG